MSVRPARARQPCRRLDFKLSFGFGKNRIGVEIRSDMCHSGYTGHRKHGRLDSFAKPYLAHPE